MAIDNKFIDKQVQLLIHQAKKLLVCYNQVLKWLFISTFFKKNTEAATGGVL